MKRGQDKLIMKIKRMIFLVFIIMNLVACSSEPECFFGDSVKLVKAINIGSSDYFIYLRISGFHEKETFYELYENKPTFGECRQSNILSISDVHVNLSQGVASKLVVDNRKLSVVYIEGSVQKINLKDIPIEVKSLTNKDRL